MLCCSNCFGDAFLSNIINRISPSQGKCDYCNSENANLISPNELVDYFSSLLDLYEVSVNGKELSLLLKHDWELFPTLSIASSNNLLDEIFQTKVSGIYNPLNNIDDEHILNWKEFKNELKHNNRFFPKNSPQYEHLKALLNFITLPKEEIPKTVYRARINNDCATHPKEQMGKPPAKKSSSGRANPIGIPYLYTASNPLTAIAEIRPHKGDFVTVAEFNVTADLTLADLRNPRKTISPFELDESGLNQVYSDLNYLSHLGRELSEPILPKDAQLEYISSQYLCELIKHCNFDGVIYKSSVGDGDNFAFFNDSKLECLEPKSYSVNNIKVVAGEIDTVQN